MATNNSNGAFEPLRNFIAQMDDLLSDHAGNGLLQSMDGFFQNQKLFSNFPVEWEETDSAYHIHAHISGVPKDQITLELQGNRLSITFESEQRRNEGDQGPAVYEKRRKARSFTFQDPIDEEGIEAVYENGVLHVTVPKSKTKKLSIR